VRVGHGSELSDHLISTKEPVIHSNLRIIALKDRSQDICHTEMVALRYFEIWCVVVLGQNEAALAFYNKVDVDDLISLMVHVLVVQNYLRLEQWAHPCYK
jgi:hypothetical protein